MRTLKIFVTVLILILGANFGNASGDLNFNIDLKNTRAILVEFDYSAPTLVNVKIEDKHGNELINEMYNNTTKVTKSFKMVGLADGLYNFVIKDNIKTVIKPITIKNSKVTINADERIYFKPVIKQQDQYLLFNLLSFTGNEVNVTLKNSDRKVLFAEDLKAVGVIEKVLDISKLPAGYYTFVVKNNDVSYRYPFQK